MSYCLHLILLSDATFGRGDGVAGFIDQEVEHDSYGFPYLRGRTLKGLLSEECDNLMHQLTDQSRWQTAAEKLFGKAGSTLDTIAQMHVGDACLPADLRQAVAAQIENSRASDPERLTREDVLASLTTIRRQTAIDPQMGVPDSGSLRSARVILRQMRFCAPLQFDTAPEPDLLTLLSVGTLALRRVGSGRNRGRGTVQCHLYQDEADITKAWATRFWSNA